MTAAEIRAQLDRLGLSQSAAARELGVDVRTVRNWCAEPQRNKVPQPVIRLLALMEKHPEGRRTPANDQE